MNGRGGAFAARLVRRRLLADRWVALLLFVLVAATTALGVGATRAVERAGRQDLAATVATAPQDVRDLVAATALQVPFAGPDTDPARPYTLAADQARTQAAVSLPGLLGEQEWTLRSPALQSNAPQPPTRPSYAFRLRLGSGWQRRMRLVAGRLPTRATPNRVPDGDYGLPDEQSAAVVEVAVSAATARVGRLTIGETLPFASPSGGVIRLQVVGVLDPLDPRDAFWADDPQLLTPSTAISDALGLIVTGAALAGDGALTVLSNEFTMSPSTLTLRVPVDADGVAARDPRALIPAVRRAVAQPVELDGPFAGAPSQTRLTTGLDDLLVVHLGKRRPVDAITGLLLTALLAVAAAVLLLGSRLLVERRRGELALARARGASAGQSLGLLAGEALLVGIPAAALGVLLARTVAGDAGVAGWALPTVCALAPASAACLLTATTLRTAAPGRRAGAATGAGGGAGGAGGLRGLRRDVIARHGRTAGLALLAVLAVLAATALRRRGVEVAAGPSLGGLEPGDIAGTLGSDVAPPAPADLLVVGAPTLVAVVGALVVARLVAWPLAVLTRQVRRGRGAVGFLGLARATRDGASGAAALVALTLALSTALLTAVTAATADRSTTRAAELAVAADLRVVGTGFTDPQVAKLRALPGVRAAVSLASTDAFSVGLGPDESPLTLLLAAPRDLAQVQGSLTSAPGLGADVATRLAPSGGDSAGAASSSDPLPVLVSSGLAPVGTTFSVRLRARTVPVVVVSTAAGLAGAPETSPWVLVDGDPLRARTALVLSPQAVLLRVGDPGAGAGGSPGRPSDGALIAATAPAGVAVRTPAGLAAVATSSPLVAAVRAGLPAALAVGAGYGATAVALTLLLGARARSRFVAHLRALGLSAQQVGALIGLEVLPTAVAALASGMVAGLGLAWLVLPAADLRPLTGSLLAPPTAVPPVLVVGVVLAFGLTVALSVLVAVAAGRAVSPAAAARTVEGI